MSYFCLRQTGIQENYGTEAKPGGLDPAALWPTPASGTREPIAQKMASRTVPYCLGHTRPTHKRGNAAIDSEGEWRV